MRHLSAAGEPARVFTDLAGVCVPALCDECSIEIVEQGGHRYRIRRPDRARVVPLTVPRPLPPQRRRPLRPGLRPDGPGMVLR